MYELRCQIQIFKAVKLFKQWNISYINSCRFLATTVKIGKSYSDKYVNQLHDFSEDEKFHKPDGCINLYEFKRRRKNLASEIIKFYEKSTDISQKSNSAYHLIIVPAAQRCFMVGKVPYFYRQATNFRYLTGHLLPDAALLIDIEHEGTDVST